VEIVMKKPIRNRIVEHVQVRAGDLVPHPDNFRTHPESQRRALAASYQEVGFARSLLGYRLADGRIQLIDGHLRRDIDPGMMVTVELLDVSAEEARKLLLTIDPLAGLATTDDDALTRLTAATRADSDVLNDLWQSLAKSQKLTADLLPPPQPPVEQYLVLVECRDEEEQVELLERFSAEGLKCRALLG
jgi:hypothetical protein